MVSYSRRLKSGQITCYLNRTYHVLLTASELQVDNGRSPPTILAPLGRKMTGDGT